MSVYNRAMFESSPEEFVDRYRQHAARGLIYPQPEGSPLLEFAAGGRVLYLFDRCGPYAARPGAASVIVHGVLQSWEVLPAGEGNGESLSVVGVSALEGSGRVLALPGALPSPSVGLGAAGPGRVGQTVVVQARLRLVLSAYPPQPFGTLQLGDWLRFRTEAPLHGFVLTGSAASPPSGDPILAVQGTPSG